MSAMNDTEDVRIEESIAISEQAEDREWLRRWHEEVLPEYEEWLETEAWLERRADEWRGEL